MRIDFVGPRGAKRRESFVGLTHFAPTDVPKGSLGWLLGAILMILKVLGGFGMILRWFRHDSIAFVGDISPF